MAKEIHSKFKRGKKEKKKDTSVPFHLMGRLLQLKHVSVIPWHIFSQNQKLLILARMQEDAPGLT
jgi:hypothetical protein